MKINPKHKKLVLLASMMSLLGIASITLFALSKSSEKPFNVSSSGATISNSITFNSFSNVSGHAEATREMKNGGTIKAYSTRTHSNNDAIISASDYLFFAYVNNGEENTNLTIGGASRECAPFQHIKSIRVSYNGTGEIVVNYSANGSSWSTISASSSVTKTEVDGAKYIYLSASNGTCYASSVILSYECTPSGGDTPEPTTGLSGSYSYISSFSQTVISTLNFTSNSQGTYDYGNISCSFSYVLSENSLTITYVGGDKNTDFGNYRLFNGGDDPVPNTSGVVDSDTQISIKLYNASSGINTRQFVKSN